MAVSLAVFRAQVDGLIAASDTELSELRRERLIKSAVERYSTDKPDKITVDVSGDDGNYYEISTSLTSWVEGFSRIDAIEYPAPTVASDEAPTYLDPEDWDDDYWDASKRYLYLPHHAPATGDKMRIRYTVPWLWVDSTITTVVEQIAHGFALNDYLYLEDIWVKATDQRIATHKISVLTDVDNFTVELLEVDIVVADFFAVCNLSAGLCAQAISAKYSRTSDSTFSADSVDHLSRAQQWAARAKAFIALYEEHLGIGADAGDEQGTGDFVDWDTSPGWPGSRDYLFHGKHTR